MAAVVLFARAPEREAAAKRIRGGAALFRSVIAAWLRAAGRCGATPVIACEEGDRPSLAAIAPEVPRQWIAQQPGAFGERVAAAAAVAFERGFGPVILAAIDAPPPPSLAAAVEALQRGTPILAPARDGGVNLIGLTAPDPALLEQFAPNRADLARLCLARLPNAFLLEAATDVDSTRSLANARRESIWRGYFETLPQTYVPFAATALHGVTPCATSRPPPR